MKKTFFLAAGLLAASSAVMAQSSIDTYDVGDVNLNGEVSVADATTVVNQVLANTPGSEVVTAKDLNELLQLIDRRLAAIEEKLGIAASENPDDSETPETPDANGLYPNGHEYVDLGLTDAQGRTIYWSTCNVGAESPEDYGLYFAWGDTEGHRSNGIDSEQPDGYSYDWSTAPFNNGSTDFDPNYFDTVKDEVCPNSVLAPAYDAAHVQWGGDWRMPTEVELSALLSQCKWTWCQMKNSNNETVNGYKVEKNDDPSAFIFLPASGGCYGTYLDGAGSVGLYWSSSLYASPPDFAISLDFDSSYHSRYGNYRYYGFTVRPVLSSAE